MPEGDTVWLAAKRMHQALAGEALIRGELRVPQLAALDLTGRTVDEVVARGKHLLFRFTDGHTLRSHFRMDGSWQIHPSGLPWRGVRPSPCERCCPPGTWIASATGCTTSPTW